MKSIKKHLLIVTLLLVFIPFLISNGSNYYYVAIELENQVVKESELLTSNIAEYVTEFLVNAYSITDMMAHSSDVYRFSPDEQEKLLVETIKRYPYFDLLFIQGTDGMQTARSSGTLGDRSNRWWFIRAMEEKQPFISKSYYSLAGNIAVSSVIMPIYNENRDLVGVMGSDIKLDAIQKLIDEKNKDEKKYAYVIDNMGVVVAHPDKTKVEELYNYVDLNKTILVKDGNGNVIKDEKGNQQTEVVDIQVPEELKKMVEKALSGESGIGEYVDIDGKKVISAYKAITLPGDSGNWAVITTESVDDAFSVLKDIRRRSLLVTGFLVLIVTLTIYFVSSNLTHPLIELNKVFDKATSGDLRVRAVVKSKNEIGQVANNFNVMMDNISKLIKEVKDSATVVFESSNSLTEITSQTNAATNDVATAIEEIARSAGDQARDTEMSAKKVRELADNIKKVTNSVEDVNGITKETGNLSTKGLDIVKTLTEKTIETARSSKEVNDIVLEVDQSSGKIGSITETIGDIAEKTNLLALNAAIEAARAGEHGKGFAVVADEVRKLAEQSATAASEIRGLITNIQSQSKTAVKAMDNSTAIMKEQDEAVSQTEGIFNEITNEIKSIVAKVSEIKVYNNDMNERKDEFVDIISSISTVAQQTSSATQQASASTEEQLAAMEEVANFSQNLNKLAANLQKLVETFNV